MPKKRAAKPLGRKRMKSTKGGGVPVGTVQFTIDNTSTAGFQRIPGPSNPGQPGPIQGGH